ncbi:MAG TPA: hypothetical protein DCS29_00995 [Candidatus Magasanikbacteria bacterium]|nr:MAG: hypothetical protein A2479_04620 [Candidatus Magasanikbacteria bacterium RIFOXYC2_FULL_39_8]HAT03340.1 hypothetical protein [Candidatus Magasanikbacteria bacterium]
MNKKLLFSLVGFGVVMCVALLVYVFFYRDGRKVDTTVKPGTLISEFDNLSQQNPDLQEFINDIETWENKYTEDPTRIETLSTLGIAWKSLADRTKDDRHYERALEVYKEGIEKTEHKNTLFMRNAAIMCVYLKRYDAAADFYLEAIEVTPGDQELYVGLAELYEYHLGKSSDEITSLLDKGIERSPFSSQIQSHKERYLNRLQSN